ncbi:MAG: glycosyltransferase family 9 protein [Bacillota bacterium]
MIVLRGNKLVRVIDYCLGITLVRLLSLFRRRGRQIPAKPDRILVILLGAVGDTLLLLPAMRLLAKKYPGARVSFFCTGINKELAGYLPGISEIISFEFSRLLRGPGGLLRLAGLIRLLRRKDFDLVLDFEKWVRISALVSFAAGADYTVGFKTRGQHRHYCYDLAVEKSDRHVAEIFLDVVRTLPPASEDVLPEPVWDRGVISRLQVPGPAMNHYVIIHPGAGGNVKHGAKRIWPLNNYARLITDLAGRYEKLRFVLTGTAGESALAEDIITELIRPKTPASVGGGFQRAVKSSMDSANIQRGLNPPLNEVSFNRSSAGLGSRITNMAGKTDIHQLLGLVSGALLVISGNTGTMHMAVALGVPVVALHGPTDPHKWGPRGEGHTVVQSPEPCSPCLDLGFEYNCRDAVCMARISCHEVFRAAAGALSARSTGVSGDNAVP